MQDKVFNLMTKEFQELVSWPLDDLNLLLELTGAPAAPDHLHAIMDNMRRIFTPELVSEWLRLCAELGILT
jgi:hypothetical protein